MLIKKIRNYLLRQPQISFFKKNDSGSEYFRVGESIVRLSDHLATSPCPPNTLNVVVTGDNFIVTYGNKIININDYKEFKNFLKYHIQMCDCFSPIFKKALCKQATEVRVVEKEVVKEMVMINFEGEKLQLTPKQARSLKNQIKAVEKQIKSFKLQNQK